MPLSFYLVVVLPTALSAVFMAWWFVGIVFGNDLD